MAFNDPSQNSAIEDALSLSLDSKVARSGDASSVVSQSDVPKRLRR